MTLEVETLFNGLGASYEAAFANNPTLRAFINQLAKSLSPNSHVLDVGCGTGKPVAEILSGAGHAIHGIDISSEMVEIAGSQIPGRFELADMKNFNPSKPYDGFAEWLHVGGYLALGVTPSTGLPPDKCSYDPTWDCVWFMNKLWMGNYTNELFFSENGWTSLLERAGFVIETEPVSSLFCPAGPQYTDPEVHYYVMARKVHANPLLGPYPIPKIPSLPSTSVAGVDIFNDRLVSEDLKGLLAQLPNGQAVLHLGQEDSLIRETRHQYQHFSGPSDTLPFQSGSFPVILAPWTFHSTIDLDKAIKEMVRVAHSRSSQIIILQAAPGNETVMHLNAVARSPRISHQGHILHTAAQRLEESGFRDVTLRRIRAQYEFPEENLRTRCEVAAELLAGIWHREHPQYEVIRRILGSRLRLHFQGHAHSVGNDMVVLVAKASG